eukprot:sb/3462900/
MKSYDPTLATTIQYAEDKGKELEAILSELSCEFATTACLKLCEAPKLLLKLPTSESDDEIVPLGTTLVLAPNKDNLAKEVKKLEDKDKPIKQKGKSKSRSYFNNKPAKPKWVNEREAALVEQMDRFAPLREAMPQAAFGLGSETKYDTEVRDALQLPAERFEVLVNLNTANGKPLNLDVALVSSGVLSEVQKNLGIDSERFDLVAEQYSLNMYGKGGHFKKHKDTPRGSDMVGTLLVQLPGAYYEGGALKISVGDGLKKKVVLDGHKTAPGLYSYGYERERFKWQLPDPKNLRIAAFFCDIDHEVLKVEEGIRITVAFLLRVKEKIVPELASEDLNSLIVPKRPSSSEQADSLAAKFVEFCNDESFLPVNPLVIDVTPSWEKKEGGEPKLKERPTFLAFPCFHLYTNEQVFPNYEDSAEEPLTSAQVAALKGKDAVIGKAALLAAEKTGGCVEIYLQPMVDHDYAEDCGGPYLTPKFPDRCRTSEKMSDEDIKEVFETNGNMDSEILPIWVIDQKMGHKPKVVGGTEWNADGYFGNEASDISFYVKSLLRVEFASYEKRKAMIDKAGNEGPDKENWVPGSKRKGQRMISETSKPKKLKIENMEPGDYWSGRYVVSRSTSPLSGYPGCRKCEGKQSCDQSTSP